MIRINKLSFLIGIISCNAIAQDSTHFGIGAMTNSLVFNNPNYGEKGLKNTTMIGGRYFINSSIAIDLGVGFSFNSSVDADTASLTPKDPGIENVSGQLGIFYKITPNTWKSYLGLLFNGGLAYQRWYDAVQLKDTTRVLPAPPKNNYVTYTVVEPYSVQIPFLFIGIEPGYTFDRHFSLFANFGINAIRYPNSKAINSRSTSTNNGYIASLPLVERKDASYELSVSSVGLGVRYLF